MHLLSINICIIFNNNVPAVQYVKSIHPVRHEISIIGEDLFYFYSDIMQSKKLFRSSHRKFCFIPDEDVGLI